MGQLFLGIWQGTPIWVWPLFGVLLVIGFMSMRDRKSSIIPYFFYPLFGLSAANAISSLVHTPLNWIVFGLAYLVGLAWAFRWQDGLIIRKTGWKMQLRGDRITLLILMIIFFSNFVNGVVAAVSPHLREEILFTIIFATIVGACAGSFSGRALRVITLKQR